MERRSAVAILVVGCVLSTACGSRTASTAVASASAAAPTLVIAQAVPIASASPIASPVLVEPAATRVPTAMPVSTTPSLTPVPATPTRTATRPPTAVPTATPPFVPGTPVPSGALPTPAVLPATNGCIFPPGTQAPGGGGYQDCIAYGLPPGAPVTLTVNGVGIPLRVGPTTVSTAGAYYFPWTERTAVLDTFVVSAGGVVVTFVAQF